MTYNPELVKHILGEKTAELFDGTMTIEPAKDDLIYGNLKAGDKLTFTFKNPGPVRQFVVK